MSRFNPDLDSLPGVRPFYELTAEEDVSQYLRSAGGLDMYRRDVIRAEGIEVAAQIAAPWMDERLAEVTAGLPDKHNAAGFLIAAYMRAAEIAEETNSGWRDEFALVRPAESTNLTHFLAQNASRNPAETEKAMQPVRIFARLGSIGSGEVTLTYQSLAVEGDSVLEVAKVDVWDRGDFINVSLLSGEKADISQVPGAQDALMADAQNVAAALLRDAALPLAQRYA